MSTLCCRAKGGSAKWLFLVQLPRIKRGAGNVFVALLIANITGWLSTLSTLLKITYFLTTKVLHNSLNAAIHGSMQGTGALFCYQCVSEASSASS